MDPNVVYMVLMIVLMVLMVLFAIAMVVIVALQKSAESGLGALSGSSDSFLGRGKAKTFDQKLKRWTIVIAISMLICSILFFVFYLLRYRAS